MNAAKILNMLFEGAGLIGYDIDPGSLNSLEKKYLKYDKQYSLSQKQDNSDEPENGEIWNFAVKSSEYGVYRGQTTAPDKATATRNAIYKFSEHKKIKPGLAFHLYTNKKLRVDFYFSDLQQPNVQK